MGINFDKAFGIHQHAMVSRSERSQVLATNIANADTPNFKAKDVDFKALIANSKRQQSGSGSLSQTHDKHFKMPSINHQESLYIVPNQPDTGDGNTVDVQLERNKFLENSLQYQASVNWMGGKIKGLKKALSGQ